MHIFFQGHRATPVRFGMDDEHFEQTLRDMETSSGEKVSPEVSALLREALERREDQAIESMQKYGAHPDADTLYSAEAALGKPATLENILAYEEGPDNAGPTHYWLAKALHASPRNLALNEFFADRTIERSYFKDISPGGDLYDHKWAKARLIRDLSALKTAYQAESNAGELNPQRQQHFGKLFYDTMTTHGARVGGDLSHIIRYDTEREKLLNDKRMIHHLSSGINSFNDEERYATAFLLFQDLMSRYPDAEATPLPLEKSWNA